MKVSSRSFQNNERIPETFAMGIPGENGPVPGPNKSPHLSWSDFPIGTKQFAIVCHDPDAPSRPDDANKSDRSIPYDFPRADFFHWVLVGIPAETTELAEGQDSDGLTPKGKATGKVGYGIRGVNTYTAWFGDDAEMGGDYGGYDGPWPPFNDERLHHYHFTVYALDTPSLDLPERFEGPDALKAMQGHILDQAVLIGTYALNPNARE
ncbi:MAG: YbhB/YbcL family Raf kinase inhibitor-like protein [Nitrospiria bacterium]